MTTQFSVLNETFILQFLPYRNREHWEEETEVRRNASGYDRTLVLINSQRLWLPEWVLYRASGQDSL